MAGAISSFLSNLRLPLTPAHKKVSHSRKEMDVKCHEF
jgi:hypothetical protein